MTRTMRLPIVALCCFVALFLRAASASDLAIGPLQVVAGGGAGEGAAALATGLQPASVLATDAGLWIADEQFNRVRFVTADGTMHTVVGSGAYGFDGVAQPALRSRLGIVADLAMDRQGHLLLVDLANRQIRILLEDGRLHTFVGADHPLFTTVAGTFAPASVAVGPAGGVHVADRGTQVVWQFDTDGQGRRVAGNGTRGFSGDGAPAALGQLADPRAVAVSDDGAIWIADTGNGRVRVVAPDGRLWTVAGDGSDNAFDAGRQVSALMVGLKPIDVAIGPDQQVFVLDARARQVLRLERAPGFADGDLVGPTALTVVHRFAADTSMPVAINVGGDGTIYVADRGARRVLALDGDQVDGTRAVAGNGTVRAAGDGTAALNAALYAPAGMDFAADGTLFFADRLNDAIRRVGTDGIIRSAADLPLSQPEDIAFDRQGRAFVADTGNDRVVRLDPDGGVIVVAGPVAAESSPLRRPTALAFDAENRLLIADSGHRVVRRLEHDGRLTTVAGNGLTFPVDDGGPATASAILQPVDIKVDSRGVLWIADAGAHRVYRLGADGLLRLVAGTGSAGRAEAGSLARQAPLNTPTGVEPDGAGGLIIADSGNSRLVHVDANGVLQIVADEGAGTPTRLSTTPTGDVIFTDVLTHRVLQRTVRATILPVAQRIAIDHALWQVETLAALPLPELQQIAVHPLSGVPLVTSRSSVTAIDASGRREDLLSNESNRFHTSGVTIDDFGASLLLVTTTGAGQPKPMTLVRFGRDGTDRDVERYDLDFFFAGAGALTTGSAGDVFMHQAGDGSGDGSGDGRLLRLRPSRLLNIPGYPQALGGRGIGGGGIDVFAELPAESAVLVAAAEGGVYLALQGSRDILLLRDLDGNGSARGPLEQRHIGTVPETPVALAVTGDGALYAATAANRIYHIDGSVVTLVAEGFAPSLIDLKASADGGLLVLEGDRRGGRLLVLQAARPTLAVWPAGLDFGAVPFGQEVTATIVLRNDGPLTAHVTPVTTGLALSAGAALQLAPGESYSVEARWAPPAPGQTTTELQWRDDNGRTLLQLPVAIHGLAPRLEVAGELDLGTTWVGGTRQAELPLGNAGDAELQVTGLELIDAGGTVRSAGQQVSALGFAASVTSTTLPSGGSGAVSVTLAPLRREPYAGTLRLLTNDPLHPSHDIALHGKGGGAILTISEIDLGMWTVGKRHSQSLTLSNTGDLDLRINSILTGTRQLILTPRWLTVGAGQSQTVRMDFAPTVFGEVTGQLTLLTNDPARPQWSIPFHGLGVSRQLVVSASNHDFGAVAGPQRWSLELSNAHERRLSLLEVSTDEPAFRVISAPPWIDPGTTGTIVVEFLPVAQTQSTGQLLLRTDLSEAPEVTIALRGRSRAAGQILFGGLTPQLDLWPDEDLQLPLDIIDAAGLRGAVFTITMSSGMMITGIDFPPASLLRQAGEPLLVMDSDDDGVRVGLSLTGSGGSTISGTGELAVLSLRVPPGRLPASVAVRLSAVVARSFSGADEPLVAPAAVELGLRWKGDINGDGQVDISDVFMLIDAINTSLTATEHPGHDLDGDGTLGPADVQLLLTHLPGAAKPAALPGMPGSEVATLLPPFPNPFNAETVLTAVLPGPTYAELSVYNLLGQRIRTLRSQVLPAGPYRVSWDGTDDTGHAARSGAYFAILDASGRRSVQRLLLLR